MRVENQITHKQYFKNRTSSESGNLLVRNKQSNLNQAPLLQNSQHTNPSSNKKSDSVSFGFATEVSNTNRNNGLIYFGVLAVMAIIGYCSKQDHTSKNDSFGQPQEIEYKLNDEEGAAAIQELQDEMDQNQQRRDMDAEQTIENIRQEQAADRLRDQQFEAEREANRRQAETDRLIRQNNELIEEQNRLLRDN